MTAEAFQHGLMSFSRRGERCCSAGLAKGSSGAPRVARLGPRCAHALAIAGKDPRHQGVGSLDSSSTTEMMPDRTMPPTLRRQPSTSWRLNDLCTVLPFTAIEIIEPVGM